RLSWVVELLPYLDEGDGRSIDPNASWNEGKNLRLARRLIPQLINTRGPNPAPALLNYPGMEGSLLAATHFVGISGVGFDAAEYRADDPATAKKLGIFGYGRVTRPDDVKGGLEQTILLI